MISTFFDDVNLLPYFFGINPSFSMSSTTTHKHNSKRPYHRARDRRRMEEYHHLCVVCYALEHPPNHSTRLLCCDQFIHECCLINSHHGIQTPFLVFTFYTNVLITFTWGVNISKVFKIYSFYLMRNKGIYYYYYYYYYYYFWLMRLIFPAWRLKKKSTINKPQKFLSPYCKFCKWQEDEADTVINLTFFLSFEPKLLTFLPIRSYQRRLWGTPYVISNISFNSSKKVTISQLYQWVRKERRRENEDQTLAGHSTSGLWSFASDLPSKCIII